MGEAKIRLSQKEREIILDTSFILTKRAVIEKISSMLTELQAEERKWLAIHFPENEFTLSAPKISKGENYLGLPYLVLDYPRMFGQEDILAIRTLFWWGNYFSATLHLAGGHKIKYCENVILDYYKLKDNGFSVCINSDQWSHEFTPANYILLNTIDQKEFRQICEEGSFIKIAKKIPLDDWENLPELLMTAFQEISRALINYQGDEIIP